MIFSIDQKPKNDIAIISEDGSNISYGELCNRIKQIGQLVDQSKKHCLIFCMCKNQPEALMGYLAFLDSKAVPLLLDANLSEGALDSLMKEYQPAYIWRPSENNSYELVELGEGPKLHEDLALLLATSGSTGSPKLVRISQKNLSSNAKAIVEYLKLTKEERPLTVLPMQYTYGLSVLNSHLYAGATLLMTQKSVLELDFWKFADAYQATSISGVPYTYELLDKLKFTNGSLGKTITTMTQAGGHLSKELQEKYASFAKAHDKKFVIMYGQTEATARMSYLPWDKCQEKAGSIGIAIPGGRFEISDGESEGELIYYGDNVSLGYATKKEDLLLGDERKGRLETGDLARQDEDGYFYLVGRKNRFVKMRGNRVSLDGCEDLLANKFQGEFACVGLDDHIIVYFTNRELKDLHLELADALGIDFRLCEERFIRELPRTAAGKIDRNQLLYPHPYHLAKEEKDQLLTKELLELTEYHKSHSSSYGAMLEAMGYDKSKIAHYKDLPFIPAGLFKQMELHSMGDAKDEDYRVATSSGTSASGASKVFVDGETRTKQQEALAHIGTSFLGGKRLPMLVIDCPSTITDQKSYSARTAGILGFSMFARERVFALTDQMVWDHSAVKDFLDRHGDGPFLIFGFTFLVWQYLCQEDSMNQNYDLSQGILIHGGGWKKLENQKVSREAFHKALKQRLGITHCHDYYGMAEQAGSIFMECQCGHLHASDYSAVLIRRATDFSVCKQGERGIIQVLSTLPKSYPGHSILTEDEGVYLGCDDCPCGRRGDYFKVLGRIKNAEIRGCSDSY